jgi:putative SOS response-associated peptidase YedK
MCGKFTQMMSWSQYVDLADLIGAASGPIETVTPMRDALVIRLSEAGQRETKRMRWGFVPAWAKHRQQQSPIFTPAPKTLRPRRPLHHPSSIAAGSWWSGPSMKVRI